MSIRDKKSIGLLALGILFLAVSVAMDSALVSVAGLSMIGITIRYRRKPPGWEYLAFLVLVISIAPLVPSSSPLLGATPLMLSYILDYLDDRRRRSAADLKESSGPPQDS